MAQSAYHRRKQLTPLLLTALLARGARTTMMAGLGGIALGVAIGLAFASRDPLLEALALVADEDDKADPPAETNKA